MGFRSLETTNACAIRFTRGEIFLRFVREVALARSFFVVFLFLV